MNNEYYNFNQLAENIKLWGKELGFFAVGISSGNLPEAEQNLKKWLESGMHGEMDYMQKKLLPHPESIISCAMNYFTGDKNNPHISRHASGRDYHKLVLAHLNKLTKKINEQIDGVTTHSLSSHGLTAGSKKQLHKFNYHCFVDTTRIMEKATATQAGIGWQGKNSLVINPKIGSWFFLGEIYTDLPLSPDTPMKNYCGDCSACIKACPTKAIVAPYQVNAKRCIAYLTIEHHGAIPEELKPLIGTRIFGCDCCQEVCPWNRFAKPTDEPDFKPRNNFNSAELIELFSWNEQEFLNNTEGRAIRRIGYELWLRNIAVALGNMPKTPAIIKALKAKQNHSSKLVCKHVNWALTNQTP